MTAADKGPAGDADEFIGELVDHRPRQLAGLGGEFPPAAAPFQAVPPLPPTRPGAHRMLPLDHFIAQIGVFSAEDRADKVISQLLSEEELRNIADLIHMDMLASRKHDALYAVRIGPFFERQDAKGICERIKRHSFECIALRREKMSVAFAVGRY